jgi:hypothetical protein
LEISSVAAPECIAGGLHQFRTGSNCMVENRVNSFPTVHVVADAEFSRTGSAFRDADIVRQIISFPNGKNKPRLQIKKRHRTMLKLRADNPVVGNPSPSR